ncbi:MAG TPA: hypothetical protein DD490_00280 [Acidobacteria bacterium]|nr:hypothetical protein [Acidobacteriota bacterium]
MTHTFRRALAALLVGLALGPSPVLAEPGPVERYFLLLFDAPLGGMRQLDEVSATVGAWIARELHPADAAAVVSYYGQELQIAQDFTRDHAALREAIDAAVRGQSRAGVPVEPGCPSLLARLETADGASLPRAESFYAALQVLAETVDSVPGPKGLLVFSKGFGRAWGGDGAPVDLSAELLEKYLPALSLYEPTREALLSRQIRLYPVDLATDHRETFPLAGVMIRLAGDTGGRYVYPVTELPRVLEQIARQAAPADDLRTGLSAGVTAE